MRHLALDSPICKLIQSRIKICRDFIAEAVHTSNPLERDRILARAAIEIDFIADLMSGEKPKEDEDVKK